ncbi:ubiquinone/menaquinone biosynthesis C-methylase UbiE [Microbacterium sp. ZKA21]|uniref:class I SAM-dependent methyltransferase n=1 Tax=Microbacterium sp. ZKA21 TaxID=3381694 RepID=UPI003D1D24A0
MSDTDRLGVVRDAFDRRAATYDESVMHRELAACVADFAELVGVRDVLDIATGTGLVLRALRARAADLRLTGVDISPGMLDVARQHLPRATWVEADVAALPVPDCSADLITCVTALHAIPDTRAALTEWRRVLRADGRAVTATFAEERPRVARVHRNPYPSDHEPFGSAQRLTEVAAATGFRVTRTMTWADTDDALLVAEWAPAQ